MINDNVEITVVDVRGNKVRLGINAPHEVSVYRKEIWLAIQAGKNQNNGPEAVPLGLG